MSSFEFDFSAPPTREPTREVYTPSRLNKEARLMLERGFAALWVEGEISNLSRPSSGHWYFSLKDAAAQLRCVMFRQKNMLIPFAPKDGMHVQIRGRVSLYEARGDYQFLVDHMEEAGEGALRRRFELLKAKLAAEGLFESERKRPRPTLPRRIGVITSPTGAAVRDVLNVLRRRFCSIPVLIYPVPVQGAAAAAQIAAAIRLASRRAECDVLILARGGGSLEDLWAFNEESVARAMYECSIPIVSGIGHEVDYTIADFVADLRAPTPSGAAELVAPDCNEWTRRFAHNGRRLVAALRRGIERQDERMTWLQRRLAQVHPGVELRQRAQRLDDLEQRLTRAVRHTVLAHRSALAEDIARLRQASPLLRLTNARARLQTAEVHLKNVMRHGMHDRHVILRDQLARLRHAAPTLRLAQARARVTAHESSLPRLLRKRIETLRSRCDVAGGRLNAVSPLATLQRGYAIVTNANGNVVTDSSTLAAGDLVTARLAQGSLRARIVDPGSDS